jgi:plasmid stabilization system protein ParE
VAESTSGALTRYFLSKDAEQDLEEILVYLDGLPLEPADRIARYLQFILDRIGEQPYLGSTQSYLTRLLGQEVRSRLAYPYRIFYRFTKDVQEVFAILHGARDQISILTRRFS